MKKLLVFGLLALLPAQLIFASTVVRSGDTITVAENQSVASGFYAVGGTVALSGKMSDDVVIIGGNVTVGGEVNKDLSVLAGTVNIQSPVKEDVRIVAGQVTISDVVEGNLVVVAGKLTVLSSAHIKGDILFYGEDAVIGGIVDGRMLGSSHALRLDAEIKSGVDVTTDILTLGEMSKITGDVTHTSRREAVKAEGAEVSGSVIKKDPVATVTSVRENARSIAIFFLISLFSTLSFYLMSRRLLERYTVHMSSKFTLHMFIGLVSLFVLPVAGAIMMLSMLGSIVGFIILGIFVLLLALAIPLMAVSASVFVSLLIDKKVSLTVPYILLGSVFVSLCLLVPIIGAATFIVLFLITFGGLINATYQFIVQK